jgi:hypothetical protein
LANVIEIRILYSISIFDVIKMSFDMSIAAIGPDFREGKRAAGNYGEGLDRSPHRRVNLDREAL